MISVIVPVFDERNTVGEVLRRVRQTDLPAGVDLEIIVVDDGSTDGTDKVLRAVEDSTVRMVRHDRNRGQGAAIRTGLTYARGDVVLMQDADLEYDPNDIFRMVQPVLEGRADVVLGTRFRHTRPVMSLSGMLLDRAVSITASLLYNTNLSDVETGYRAFSSSALAKVTIESDRFAFGPELTAKLLRKRARFVEIPVSYSGRVVGQKFKLSDRFRAIACLVRHRFASMPSEKVRDAEVIDLRDAERVR
jgi:glycosyltransferase involved in cell wall biosynthesis